MLESSSHPILVVDREGRIRYVNGSVRRVLGYVPGTLVGRNVDVVIPARHATLGADAAGLSARAARAWLSATPISVPCADGSMLPVTVETAPVDTDDGAWVVVRLTDVTATLAAEGRAARMSRAYRTLADTNQAILRAQDERQLYVEVCQIAVESGGYFHAAVFARPDRNVVVEASAGAFETQVRDAALTLDAAGATGKTPVLQALRGEGPVYVTDFRSDPATAEYAFLAEQHRIAAAAAMPLRCGNRVIAALALYTSLPDLFDGEMREMLESMADNVSFALGALDTNRRLKRTVFERANLLDQLMNAEETERQRIAADVHDHTVQELAALDLRLTLLQRKMTEGTAEPAEVDLLRTIVTQSKDGLRQLLYEMQSIDVSAGLASTLRDECDYIFTGTPTSWSLTVDDDAELPGVECAQAVRIAKEALLNARAHANATTVQLTLRRRDGGVEIAIIDNGQGMAGRPTTSPRGHRGLDTMRERATATGGTWTIESDADAGTTIRFWLPDIRSI